MMRTPSYYSADQIKNWDVQQKGKNGLWTQARPMSYPGFNLFWRIRCAWSVFTGKNDVLVWVGND